MMRVPGQKFWHVLTGRIENPPDMPVAIGETGKTPEVKGATRRDITGTWEFVKNHNPFVEALQALYLKDNGIWQLWENQTEIKSPGTILAKGEWWMKSGVLHTIEAPHNRHADKDKIHRAAIIHCDKTDLWLRGAIAFGKSADELHRLKFTTEDQFINKTQTIQAEQKAARKLAFYIIACALGGLLVSAAFIISMQQRP